MPPGGVVPPEATPPEETPFWRKRWFLITAAVVVAILIYVALSRPDDETGADPSGSPSASASTSASQAASSQPGSAPAEATAAPTSTPPPTPSPTPELGFEPIALSGTGDAIPQFTIPADAPAIATITHQGESNFAVITLAEDGSENDLLVNRIGNYAGTVLFDADEGQHSVAFEVTADGAWTIDIKPVTEARAWDPASAIDGTGDDVLRTDPEPSGLTPITVSHQGESNFVVIAHAPDGAALLVNEIGNYSGEVALGAGSVLVQVNADGTWSIAP